MRHISALFIAFVLSHSGFSQEIYQSANQRFGLKTGNSETELAADYESIISLGNGYFIYSTGSEENYAEEFDEWGEPIFNYSPAKLGIVNSSSKTEEIYDAVHLNRGKVIIAAKGDSLVELDKSLKVKELLPYDFLWPYDNGFVFKQNDKYGLLNLKLKEKVPALYDDIYYSPEELEWYEGEYDLYGGDFSDGNDVWGDFSVDENSAALTAIPNQLDSLIDFKNEGYLKVKKGDKIGVVDSEKFKILIEPVYNKVELPEKSSSARYIKVSKNDKYGLLDRKKFDTALPLAYQEIDLNFTDKLTKLEKDDNITLVESNSLIPVSEQQFEAVSYFMHTDYFLTKVDGLYGLRDSLLQPILKEAYSHIKLLGNVYLDWLEEETDISTLAQTIVVEKDGKYGLIHHETYEEIHPPQFDFLEADEYGGRVFFRMEGKMGIMDSSFAIVLEPLYDYIYEVGKRPVLTVSKNDKYGLLHPKTYKVILPLEYDNIKDIKWVENSNVVTALCSYQGKYGRISSTGDTLIPFKFQAIDYFSKDYFMVTKDGKKGLYSQTSYQPVTKIIYTSIQPFGIDYIVKSGNTYQLLDGKSFGPLKTEFDYCQTHQFTATVGFKNKYGVLKERVGFNNSLASSIKINMEYDLVRYIDLNGYSSDKPFVLKKNERCGLMSLRDDHQLVLDFKYKDIYVLNTAEGLLALEADNTVYLYNYRKDKFVDTLAYDSLERVLRLYGYMLSKKNGKYGLVNDDDFKEVLPPVYDRITNLVEDDKTKVSLYKNGEHSIYNIDDKSFEVRSPSISQHFETKWKTLTGYATYRSTITEANGKIHLGTNGNGLSNGNTPDALDALYVLDSKSGKLVQKIQPLWEQWIDSDINGVVAVGDKVIMATDAGILYGYSQNGKKLWSYDVGAPIEGAPVVADVKGDNTQKVFIVTREGSVFAVDVNSGEYLWSYNQRLNNCMTSPAIGDIDNDGKPELITSLGLWLTIFDPLTGVILYRHEASGSIETSPVVRGNDVYYTSDDHLNRFSYLSKKVDQVKIDSEPYGRLSQPTKLPQSEVFVYVFSGGWSDGGGKILFVDFKKGLIEKHTFPGALSATPLVANLDDNPDTYEVLCVSEQANVVILNEAGEILKEFTLDAGVEATPLLTDIDNDGLLEIIINDIDGYTTCYETPYKASIYFGQYRGNNLNHGVVD